MEPDNARYKIRLSQQLDFTNPSEAVRQWVEANRLNPRLPDSWLALGLYAEAQGQREEAERLLQKAVDIDHQFKPIWTLINFYMRTGQKEKMWPNIAKAIDVITQPDLGYFDLRPIFDICRAAGADNARMLSLLPHRDYVQKYYFFYLVENNQPVEALPMFDTALRTAETASLNEQRQFVHFDEIMFANGRQAEAAGIWNKLVEHKLVASTAMHPEKGDGIANPNFTLPFEPQPFGWQLPERNVTATTYSPGSVWFEFTGQQPESSELLVKNLAVLPDKTYFVTWNATTEGLSINPEHDGLMLLFLADGKQLEAKCTPFLAKQDRGCTFHSPRNTAAVRMIVAYERQPGTVRLRGGLRLNSFSMTFAPAGNS